MNIKLEDHATLRHHLGVAASYREQQEHWATKNPNNAQVCGISAEYHEKKVEEIRQRIAKENVDAND